MAAIRKLHCSIYRPGESQVWAVRVAYPKKLADRSIVLPHLCHGIRRLSEL